MLGIAALALGAAGGGWFVMRSPRKTPVAMDQPPAINHDEAKSVAVLPFANLSGDPAQEYFSDGLTEEILTALTNERDLRVPGLTSVFSFKGRKLTAQEIARRFGLIHSVSHPDPGYLGDAPKRQVYAEFLTAMREQENVWHALPTEVATWWRGRDAGGVKEECAFGGAFPAVGMGDLRDRDRVVPILRTGLDRGHRPAAHE